MRYLSTTRVWRLLLVASLAMVAGLLAAQQAAAAPLTKGDVLAGTGNGKIKEFTPDGTLVQTLDTTTGSFYSTGMCFDSARNLYATLFNGGASKFSSGGSLLSASFGSGYNANPESCTVSGSDQVYVGQADGSGDILKFDTAGNPLGSFSPTTGPRGTDWIDLGADQCTMYYTSEGNAVHRFDVCTNTQLADFATGLPGTNCFAHRTRSNGEVLVACTDQVHRLSPTGTILQTYTGLAGYLFALNLDPDGTSFWTGDLNGGQVYKVDISTGNVLKTWNASPDTALGGLAVIGELTAAQEGPPGDPSCSDGIDNDKDGLIDGADPGCQGGGGGGGKGSMYGTNEKLFAGGHVVLEDFAVHCAGGAVPPNMIKERWRASSSTGAYKSFALTGLTSVTCSDDPAITNPPHVKFDTIQGTGTGTYNGDPGATITFKFTDEGRGPHDRKSVEIKDAAGNVVLSFSNAHLAEGNNVAKP